MNTILFTTYPDEGPCLLAVTDMPVSEAENIEHTGEEQELKDQIEALGYKVKKIITVDAVMDWVNGQVEER